MILYEYVYNHGERAEGVFYSAKCAEDKYADDPYNYPRGCATPIDEQESEELVKVGGWEICSCGCGKSLISESLQGVAEAAQHSEIEDAGAPTERKD